jgi:uncharacterized membrane protein YbhN (UPF0104 family)
VPGWVRTAAGLVILALVVWFFARRAGQTMDLVREAWQPVSWLYLALSFALVLVCLFLMALLWYGILRTMGGQLPLVTALRFYGITLLPRYLPGMVWGYVGRTLLCERRGITRNVATGSAMVEVGLIVGSGFLLVLLKYLAAWWIVLIILPSLLLMAALLSARPTRRQQKTLQFKRVATWCGWGFAYAGFWLLYGASSWLVALSVAPGLTPQDAPEIVVRSIAAWLAGFLAVIVPGGLGVREGVFALTLVEIVGPAEGAFIPLLARSIGILAELMFFLICLLLVPDPGHRGVLRRQQDMPD